MDTLRVTTYIDGYLDIAPVSHAVKTGAKRIAVILTFDPNTASPMPKHRTVLSLLMRIIEGFQLEGMREDLKACAHHVDITVFSPSQPLGPSLDFDPAAIQRALALGYEDAQQTLGEEGDHLCSR